MRVVFDTNVFVSGYLFTGAIPRRLVAWAFENEFEIFLSPELLEELKGVLDGKFSLALHKRDRLLRMIQGYAKVVYPTQRLKLVAACENDNRILECALEARAEYLVTGDKRHLLPLKHDLPFSILSPRAFYQLVLSRLSAK